MKHFIIISAAIFLFCISHNAIAVSPTGDDCAACQMMKMIKPGSPFFELAKSMHPQSPKGALDQHWFCDYYYYYDPSGTDFLKWEHLPTSKWGVKFSPACVCTVWTVTINYDISKNSPAGKGDTLDIFVHEATSPYTQIFKQYFLINAFSPQYDFILYPPLGSPYSQGSPVINTKRDFIVAWKMRGPSSDSAQWYFKTPAINPSLSLKFTSNTSTQTASAALGQSVDINHTSELCIHIPLPCTIPVELSSYSAQVQSHGIKLFWETATESNNYGFQIQRSKTKDGPWEDRGFVSGKGNSTAKQQYSFADAFEIDNEILRGNDHYWYRLKQIDFDGTFEELQPILISLSAEIPAVFELNQNFPNPVSSSIHGLQTTTIQYIVPHPEQILIKIYDTFGREIVTLVNEKKETGTQYTQWNAKDLPAGTYLVKMSAGAFTATKKILLLR